MKMDSFSQCGFSLVELLVVITIIGLLATLSLGVVQSAMRESRRGACISNLKQIGTAFWNYLGDNDLTLPQRFYQGDEGYKDRLAPYLGASSNNLKKVFICPEHRLCAWPHQPSYGMNLYLDNLSVNQLKSFSDLILVAESRGDGGRGSHRACIDDVSPGQRDLVRHGKKSNYLMMDGHVESQIAEWANQTNRWGDKPQ